MHACALVWGRFFFRFVFATVCVWGVVVDGGSWLLPVVLHVCALTKDTPEPWMVWDARSLVVGGRLVCCPFFFPGQCVVAYLWCVCCFRGLVV